MADGDLEAQLEATLAARRDLGEDYDAALAKSFVEKLDREVAARVQAALSMRDPARGGLRRGRRRGGTGLAVTSIVLGIPVTSIVVSQLHGIDGLVGIVVAWGAIAVINVANAVERSRR